MGIENRKALLQMAMKKACDELDWRKARCRQLLERMDEMDRVGNHEQAEAYEVRINQHKPRVLALIEHLAVLEKHLAA